MKCDRVLELLSDYLDGELSPAAVLGVQSHLRRCETCETEYEACGGRCRWCRSSVASRFRSIAGRR
jgi:anti-sigma factor RsiW